MSTDPTHAARLAQIREREQQATAGPWASDPLYIGLIGDVSTEDGATVAQTQERVGPSQFDRLKQSELDAAFIAHARADVPYLLDALAQRDAQLAQMRAQVKALQTHLCLGRLTGKWFPAVNRDELLALLEPKTP